MKKSIFWSIFSSHSSSGHFLLIISDEETFSFLTKSLLMFYIYAPINHISGFSMPFCKDRVQTEISSLLFPLGTSDAVKPKWL